MQLAVVSEVFDSALALMDELDESGAARGARTEDYAHRTPGIVNALLAELRAMTGARWRCMDVRGMDDPLPGVEETYAAPPWPMAWRRRCWWMRTPTRRPFSTRDTRS